MSAPRQLLVSERCPRCGRHLPSLGHRAQGLLLWMRWGAAMPSTVAPTARAQVRRFLADRPEEGEALRCHAGLCRSEGAA